MKYHKAKNSVISKIPAMLLALALCMSLVVPMADMNVYAADGDKTIAAGEGKAAASGSEKAADTAPAATAVTGYKTTYNKRYNQDLKIEADITPAGGREVQLQRYDSEKESWATILTAAEKASAVPAEDTVKAGSSDEDAAKVTEQAENADAAAAEDAAAVEDPAGAVDASGTDTAELTEENGTLHVTFTVPKEERQKTTSVWRINVPAAKNASGAVSDKITVITRNLESLGLSARTACVYRIDGNGQGTLIYTKNSCTEVAQASTTKLMTAVLLLESGLIDSTTKISAHAASTPYGSGRLAAGDVFSTRDLLYAMLLPSSNDAATAVAERVGGSERAFVKMMNDKAKELGFTRTQFRNPHGLDADGHYTTALELAELTAYAYTFPEIRDCWATQFKSIRSLDGKRWNLWSTNALFGYVSNFLGGKTGTEDNARCCFTGVYTFQGDTYVTVVLGSGYGFSRWSDTKKLHNYIKDYARSSY